MNNLIDWVKLAPRFLWAIGMFCAALIFAPNATLVQFGMRALVEDNRGWFGFGFLASAVLLLVHAFANRWPTLSRRIHEWRFIRARGPLIARLDPNELDLLRRFFDQNSQTLHIELASHGRAEKLVRDQILIQGSVGNVLIGMPFTVQPWAWEYMRAHPEVLNKSAG